jgi:hypothetical protein
MHTAGQTCSCLTHEKSQARSPPPSWVAMRWRPIERRPAHRPAAVRGRMRRASAGFSRWWYPTSKRTPQRPLAMSPRPPWRPSVCPSCAQPSSPARGEVARRQAPQRRASPERLRPVTSAPRRDARRQTGVRALVRCTFGASSRVVKLYLQPESPIKSRISDSPARTRTGVQRIMSPLL